MDVLEGLVWAVIFGAFVAGLIGTVVHSRMKLHAPIWAVVLIGIALVVLPFFGLLVYWLVCGVIWIIKRSTTTPDAP